MPVKTKKTITTSSNKPNKKMWEFILLGVGLFFAGGVFWTYMQLTRSYMYNATKAPVNNISWPQGETNDKKNNTKETTTTSSDHMSDKNKSNSEVTADISTQIDDINNSNEDTSLNDNQLNDLNIQ